MSSGHVVQLSVLPESHAWEIYSILTCDTHAWETQCAELSTTIPHTENSVPSESLVSFEIPAEPWEQLVSQRAIEAITKIDERLKLFPHIRDHFQELWQRRTRKRAGRRRLDEHYWLASEIAEIIVRVPGIEVKASKSGPTRYSKIVELCFRAVGHTGSTHRVTITSARQRQPVIVDDETWATYLDATSKKKR